MPSSEEINAIFDRILAGQATEADIHALRLELQQGKYRIEAEQLNANEIHIGDRIYHGADARTIQKTFREAMGLPELHPLSEEEKREAVSDLLKAIENDDRFKYIRLFHTSQPIVLKEQFIPIQVTLERHYKHELETTWNYAESEAELKRVYALKGEKSSSSENMWIGRKLNSNISTSSY